MKKIISLILLFVVVISGCTERVNYYSGIEKKDISELSDVNNTEFVYEYRGHSDNWAAAYIVYKPKDSDNHTARMLLKYIGKQPLPESDLSYKYSTEGGGDGSGTMPSTANSTEGIYNLGYSGGNGSLASPNSTVELELNWDGNTEKLELNPVDK